MKVVDKVATHPNNGSRQNAYKFGSSDMYHAMTILNEFRRFCGKEELDNLDLDDLVVINFWLDLTVAGNKEREQ
jgi:hypothetical protein